MGQSQIMDNKQYYPYVGQMIVGNQENLFIVVEKCTEQSTYYTLYSIQTQEYIKYLESTIKYWFNHNIIRDVLENKYDYVYKS